MNDLAKRMPDDAEIAFVDSIVERTLFHDHETVELSERCAALGVPCA